MQATEDGRPDQSPVPVVWRGGAPRAFGWVEPKRLMRVRQTALYAVDGEAWGE